MEENLVEDNDLDLPELSLLKSESVQNKVDMYQKPRAIGKWGNAPFIEHTGRKYAYVDGFSLHANVKILAHRRSALERLCRYITRGAVAKERISLTSKGNVQLRLKRPYNDGTTHYQFTPEQFIKRLIALIPQPRQNFIRYYGVFGARHKNRKEITAKPKANSKKGKSKKKIYRTPWAELLKRIYKYEVLNCDNCLGKLELVATITSIEICKKILNHLKLDSATVSVTAPRAPPSQYEDNIQDDDLFNQESNW